jgi:hypothetical protein
VSGQGRDGQYNQYIRHLKLTRSHMRVFPVFYLRGGAIELLILFHLVHLEL